MAGRPPKVALIKADFLKSVDSAEKLVASARALSAINPNVQHPRLHAEQTRRVVELAFLGLVSKWEEFLEDTFVRYMAGAKSPNGFSPTFRLGKATDIAHSYHVVSGDFSFDPKRNYSKFGEPRWVIDTARIYFENGVPYSPRMQAYIEPLQSAVKIRNRVAHGSEKCKEDFKKVAKVHLGLQQAAKLKQGYTAGDLLVTKPVAVFKASLQARYQTYFETYCDLYRYLANQIVP
jgi:hypothetical protein